MPPASPLPLASSCPSVDCFTDLARPLSSLPSFVSSSLPAWLAVEAAHKYYLVRAWFVRPLEDSGMPHQLLKISTSSRFSSKLRFPANVTATIHTIYTRLVALNLVSLLQRSSDHRFVEWYGGLVYNASNTMRALTWLQFTRTLTESSL